LFSTIEEKNVENDNKRGGSLSSSVTKKKTTKDDKAMIPARRHLLQLRKKTLKGND
jgi:hypothetical protein